MKELMEFFASLPPEVAFFVRSIMEGSNGKHSARLTLSEVRFKYRGWTITIPSLVAECGHPPTAKEGGKS